MCVGTCVRNTIRLLLQQQTSNSINNSFFEYFAFVDGIILLLYRGFFFTVQVTDLPE